MRECYAQRRVIKLLDSVFRRANKNFYPVFCRSVIFVKRYLSIAALVELVELQHLAVLHFLYALLVELLVLRVNRQVSERRERHVVKLFAFAISFLD